MLAKKLPFTVERGVLVANEFAPPVTKTLMSIKKENKAGSTFIQTMGRKWDKKEQDRGRRWRESEVRERGKRRDSEPGRPGLGKEQIGL